MERGEGRVGRVRGGVKERMGRDEGRVGRVRGGVKG